MYLYLLVSHHVSGIIMPIIKRTIQSRQRLWCTTLVVLQQTRGEEVVLCALVGIGFTTFLHLIGYLFTFMFQIAGSNEMKSCMLSSV
jgi:hypothetical protein